MPLFKKKQLKKELGRLSAWAALSSVKNEQEYVQSDIVATGLVWVMYRGFVSGRFRVLRGVGSPFMLLPFVGEVGPEDVPGGLRWSLYGRG